MVPAMLRDVPTLALLVASNLIPLAGVTWWGWRLGTVMVLYWLENGVIGAITFVTMVLATPSPDRTRLRSTTTSWQRLRAAAGRAGTAVVFTLGYGFFWLVHGVFVFALFASPGSATGATPAGTSVTSGADLDWWAVATGAVALTVYQVGAFGYWQLYRGAYRQTTPGQAMVVPYARLLVLQVTIVVGAFLIARTGQPIVALVLLVLLKTGFDLGAHLVTHRVSRLAGPADPPGIRRRARR